MNLTPFLIELRKFVGTKVVHQGVCCHLLEVLADGPWLVLEDCEANTSIQENQYGGLWRRVPRTYTIPVVTADGTELHPQFLALNLAISLH
jgi:hypothetical protein